MGETARAGDRGDFLEQLASQSALILMNPRAGQEFSGTGFYFTRTQSVFLITAKHVLFGKDPSSTNLVARQASVISYGRGEHAQNKGTNLLALDVLYTRGNLRINAEQDIAVIKIGVLDDSSRNVTLSEGVLSAAGGPGITRSSSESVVRFEQLKVANEAYIVGFPRSLGKPIMTPAGVDPDRPLLRSGIIAGKDPKRKQIIVDAAVFPGNSGGPLVVRLQPDLTQEVLLIAGVVTKFVGFERVLTDNRDQGMAIEIVNTGYAVCTPIDTVLELLW